MPQPKKNVAYTFDVALVDRANRPLFKSNPTLAAGDFKVSQDNGALENLETLPEVDPSGSVIVKVALSADEMNADRVTVVGIDAAGAEWDDVLITLDTMLRTVDDLPQGSDYTALRAAKLDNLDAAITTRLAGAGYTAPANGDITSIKAKTDQMAFTTANRVDSTALAVSDKTGYALSGAGVQAIWDALTSALSTANSIGKRLADNLDAAVSSRASHSASDVWAVGTRTLTAFGFTVTVGTNTDKTGYSLSGAGIQALWDALTSALSTAGSVGKLLVDNLNAAITTRLASAGYTAPDNAGISAIQAKTDGLPADPASNTQVNTRLAGASYAAPDNAGISAIKAKTDNLPGDPASNTQVTTRLATAGYTAPNNAGIAAIQAKTDQMTFTVAGQLDAALLDKTGFALSTAGQNAVRDAIKALVIESQGSITVGQALSVLLAAVAGVTSGNGLTMKTPNGAATRVVAVVDEHSNRTSITLTPSS